VPSLLPTAACAIAPGVVTRLGFRRHRPADEFVVFARYKILFCMAGCHYLFTLVPRSSIVAFVNLFTVVFFVTASARS
jgi:hypothetical protein